MIYSSPAATAVAENQDLLINILLRLPAISLVEFKRVSKQWRSLISSTEFALSHFRFRHNNSTPTALLLSRQIRDHYVGLDYIEHVVPLNLSIREHYLPSFDFMNDNALEILDSCNGLLLCVSILYAPDGMVLTDDMVICNPATRQYRRLSCRRSLLKNHIMGNILAFDPNISPHYKVIFVVDPCQYTNLRAFEFHIYSSESDSWAPRIAYTTDLELPESSHFGPRCAFFKGAIHWIVRFPRPQSLLCFSFDARAFKKLSLPEKFITWYLGESQGQLNVVGGEDEFNFDVLEIVADYSGWSVKYHINLQSCRMAFPEGYCSILSCFHAENDESVILLRMDSAIVRFNLLDETFQKIYDLEAKPRNTDQPLDYDFKDSYQYFDSLFCV